MAHKFYIPHGNKLPISQADFTHRHNPTSCLPVGSIFPLLRHALRTHEQTAQRHIFHLAGSYSCVCGDVDHSRPTRPRWRSSQARTRTRQTRRTSWRQYRRRYPTRWDTVHCHPQRVESRFDYPQRFRDTDVLRRTVLARCRCECVTVFLRRIAQRKPTMKTSQTILR